MKPTTFTIPVFSLRRIETPFERDPGYKNYVAVIDARQLPDLSDWRDINVRDPKGRGRVPDAIRESFGSKPNEFYFMNRGLVIAAERVEYQESANRAKQMIVTLRDARIHGLLDGGHTYKIVREEAQAARDGDPVRYVRVEILTGFNRDGISDVVEARNTSNQVKDESLANLREEFDQMKDVLIEEPYYSLIAWNEYEELETGKPKPVDVRDIISYLITFDTGAFSSTRQPLIAYKDKRACLRHFLDHKKRLRKYYHLLPGVLRIWDEIHDNWAEWYKRARADEAGVKGRPMLLVGMVPEGVQELYFKGKPSKGRIPEAYKYPILSALRANVKNRGQGVRWATDPLNLLEATGQSLVGVVGTAARSVLNPNKVGKDAGTWSSCYLIVESALRGSMSEAQEKRILELEAQLKKLRRESVPALAK